MPPQVFLGVERICADAQECKHSWLDGCKGNADKVLNTQHYELHEDEQWVRYTEHQLLLEARKLNKLVDIQRSV